MPNSDGANSRSRARQWIVSGLTRIPRPEVPIGQPWRVSFGALVPDDLPKVPGLVLALARRSLNQIGQLGLGSDGIEINGEHVPWSKIIRIEQRDSRDVITDTAVRSLVDRLAVGVLRFLPGRGAMTGWLTDAAMGAVARISQTASESDTGRGRLVPTTIVYRGRFGRLGRVQLGLFQLLVLAMLPEVRRAIEAQVGDRMETATGPVPVDTSAAHRRLIIGLAVWIPIALFWVVAAATAGAAFLIVLIAMPFVLVAITYMWGIGNAPRFVVYPLGLAPVLAFAMGVDWTWPIGLLIIVMIAAYEQVLTACALLRTAKHPADDIALASGRIERITLLWVSFDAFAAELDLMVMVVLLVAIVLLGRVSTVLALAAMTISLLAFLGSGNPSLFGAIGQWGLDLPADVDDMFAFEALSAGVAAWARTAWRLWRGPR
jgi:hypothetical protein